MLHWISRLAKFLFTIYGFSVFLLFMLLLLPFFICAFLMDDVKGGNLVYRISRLWADVFFFFTGITHRNIYEAEPDPETEFIFVSNHISYLDIPMMMKVIRRRHIRILGKGEMTRIPVFGWIYKKGTVSVFRDDAEARAQSVKRLIAFVKERISVFICPEGTFNTTHHPLKNFYDGAFRIAIETQKPICPILFLDTYNRLNYNNIFSLNPGKCRGVFLPPTSTEGMTQNDIANLKQKIYSQMEEALIRYKASWIKKESNLN